MLSGLKRVLTFIIWIIIEFLNKSIKTVSLIICVFSFQSDERQQEIEKNVTDQEQRYLKYMCMFWTMKH